MKLILGLLAFGFTVIVIAQEKITDSTVIKKDNLLDMQTNILTSVFEENLDGNTKGKSIGYLELLEKTDLSEAQKPNTKTFTIYKPKRLLKNKKTL